MAKGFNNRGKSVPMGPAAQQQVNINPDDLEDVVCDECGSQFFNEVFLFKKLSAVLSPTGKDTMVPLKTYKCQECGHINKIFLPEEPKK